VAIVDPLNIFSVKITGNLSNIHSLVSASMSTTLTADDEVISVNYIREVNGNSITAIYIYESITALP